ncbi:hypothetical protein TSH7_31285 [Azospirillum sp. TSH7]|uniref:hypothetical protein n=1 Tax=unclassified Azospirillum TaxID=2630922 RepID=UPI000D608E88|nr:MULTISPECIES: hypothetical protein [unclassified Azospirillum]PWC54432.1 hypothetical protein TSH7_31285 [Azospirillum sp. TSH7]PWC71043.1 hypothetical protein TSH20_04775 [Azospirillum sp. TSH20]
MIVSHGPTMHPLDRMSIAVSVKPLYWELLQTPGAGQDMSIDLYVELHAFIRNLEKLAPLAPHHLRG